MLNIEFVQFPFLPHSSAALKSILLLFFAPFAGLCPEEAVVWHLVSACTETELLIEILFFHNTASIFQAGWHLDVAFLKLGLDKKQLSDHRISHFLTLPVTLLQPLKI